MTARGTSMLFLLFELGRARYALDVDKVVEVLPLVQLKKIPQGPAEVAGVFSYRGVPVPAIDLSLLTLGEPSVPRFSTRIILVDYPGSRGEQHLLGLIAEKVTETTHRDPADFVTSGITNERAPYLGPVATRPRGGGHWINVGRRRPATKQKLLVRDS
jgi:chemotaxis-related protein WspB